MESCRFGRDKARPASYIITVYAECVYFNQHISRCLENVIFVLAAGLVVVGTERKVVAHVREPGKERFAPDTRTARSTEYRFAVELNVTHRCSDEDELVRYD
jgi:hypothetical protein